MPGVSKHLKPWSGSSKRHQEDFRAIIQKKDLTNSERLILLQQFLIQQCYSMTKEEPATYSGSITTSLLQGKYFPNKANRDIGQMLKDGSYFNVIANIPILCRFFSGLDESNALES